MKDGQDIEYQKQMIELEVWFRFYGGLSGHQGALRAMFLKRRLSDKMSYASTASVLALCVDLTRIPCLHNFQ